MDGYCGICGMHLIWCRCDDPEELDRYCLDGSCPDCGAAPDEECEPDCEAL